MTTGTPKIPDRFWRLRMAKATNCSSNLRLDNLVLLQACRAHLRGTFWKEDENHTHVWAWHISESDLKEKSFWSKSLMSHIIIRNYFWCNLAEWHLVDHWPGKPKVPSKYLILKIKCNEDAWTPKLKNSNLQKLGVFPGTHPTKNHWITPKHNANAHTWFPFSRPWRLADWNLPADPASSSNDQLRGCVKSRKWP